MFCIIPIRLNWRRPLSGIQKVAAVLIVVLIVVFAIVANRQDTLKKSCDSHYVFREGEVTEELGAELFFLHWAVQGRSPSCLRLVTLS